MAKKAKLEMTYEDYDAVGSSPIKEFNGVRGKPLHEMYSDAELYDYIKNEVDTVAEVHRRAVTDDERTVALLETVLKFLAQNIDYLGRIGRLPKEFEDLDPMTKFALPK